MSKNIINFKNFIPKIDPSAIIFDGVHIIGDVYIEEKCSIWFGSVLRGDVNAIKIGKRSNIQDNTVIHTEHSVSNSPDFGSVQIGSDVTIGHNCIIHACKIENLCLVGMGSIIMDGACIGELSIIGAGSLITKGKIFPPKSLIMGNPAKFIRTLNEDEIKNIAFSASRYVDLANAYLK
ncbi:gamma carbonic anhydrase family protein [Helicobacter cappadocius]|uniref:Gamma carbonic anhydrase family protein n=1 Tax=Helicobacter cappadocius TaxID=3063998 RepID=A0AA90T5F5_9HELI|nr:MULTISPECIES: gamma carbonic anhydrase family protein [unclassified Helicobacter]MDO7253373.1 gamma carbonic anhydrase family protein [Helicobacter sp. faydin-H75]MDP2539363.1 gamma carbonic anhydrase family protein [Helicobacter sp. faydin-H76]